MNLNIFVIPANEAAAFMDALAAIEPNGPWSPLGCDLSANGAPPATHCAITRNVSATVAAQLSVVLPQFPGASVVSWNTDTEPNKFATRLAALNLQKVANA